MPVDNMTIDLTEFNAAVNRSLKAGELKRSEISKIFRDANRPVVKTSKSLVNRSKRGSYSKQYPSRTHEAGFLRKNIRFKPSRKYKLVYYVLSQAWYSAIYGTGHGTWKGNKFIERSWNANEANVVNSIKTGLGILTERIWKNG